MNKPKLNQPDPTIEEVEKEWEELGYKIFHSVGFFGRALTIQKTTMEITIYISMKCYEITNRQVREALTIKEHQLLTKTFRALGWDV